MLNAQYDTTTLQQLHLPYKMGGLNIYSATNISKPAYVASYSTYEPLIKFIFQNWRSNTYIHQHLNSIGTTDENARSQKYLLNLIHTRIKSTHCSSLDDAKLAWFNSNCIKGTYYFLRAIPSG